MFNTPVKSVLIAVLFLLVLIGGMLFSNTLGYSTGYQNGHVDGVRAGIKSGYTSGYHTGSHAGYQSGYVDGQNAQAQSDAVPYQNGYTDGGRAFSDFYDYLVNSCTKGYDGYYRVVVYKSSSDGSFHYTCLVG